MTSLSEISGPPIDNDTRCLIDRLEEVVKSHPDAVALICAHEDPRRYELGDVQQNDATTNVSAAFAQWTYAQLYTEVERISHRLENLGLASGCPLFTVLGNSVEHVTTTWAGYRLGCLHVSIDPRSLKNASEARHMIETVLAFQKNQYMAVVVKDRQTATQFDELFPDIECVKIQIEGGNGPWIPFYNRMQPSASTYEPKFLSGETRESRRETSVFFSSGTTSLPKACLADVASWVSALETRISAASALPGDKVMVLVSSSHAFGLMGMLITLTRGATLVYSSATGFDAELTMKFLHTEQCAYLIMVSALVHAFVAANPSTGNVIKPLKAVIFSGMSLATAVAKDFKAAFPTDRVENIFGMIEGVHVSTGPVEDIDSISQDDHLASGVPTSGARVRICAPGKQSLVPLGTPGEVHYSGFQTSKGYIGLETKDFYKDKGGSLWFNTGDQGVIHNGQLYLVGRYKELIIRAGKNLSPPAIESTLNQVPELSVFNPQAIPFPDPVAGEVPVIVVNQHISDDQVRQITKMILVKMGPVYVPTNIISVQTLGLEDYPRTISGKVQKTKLAALVRQYEDSLCQCTTMAKSTGLRDRVVRIWAGTFGVTSGDLDTHAKILERCDSITSMKIHARIRRETGKEISYSAWATAGTIDAQIKLLEDAPEKVAKGKEELLSTSLRQGGPAAVDMVHLMANPSRFQATRQMVEEAIAPNQLTWDDVEDVFPTTDFMDIMVQNHLIESWEFFVEVLTMNADRQHLRSSLEKVLYVHPILRSFIVADQQAADRALHVTIKSCKSVLDQCIVDYGDVDSVNDLRKLTLDFPQEHRPRFPGLLYRGLIVFVRETNSAALISAFSHAVMDATYHQIFVDDLDLALGGHTVQAHVSFKAWSDAHYVLGSSQAAQPALDYHAGEMELLRWPDKQPAIWPSPASAVYVSPDRVNEGLPLLTIPLPGILGLRRAHPDLALPIAPKVALALLALHHTKTTSALMLNVEMARSGFPFLPSSIAGLGSFNAADVTGPTIAGILNVIGYDHDETVIEMLHRAQEQQIKITQHANAPWQRIMQQNSDIRDLFPKVADALVFNWTGANGFSQETLGNLQENVKISYLYYRPKTGLTMDVGLGGKDGTDMIVSPTGAIWNESPESIYKLMAGFGRIATWLVDERNWDRPVEDFPECLVDW
ncbi:Nonribosomal peptide synthetases (NRPS) [Penicillium canescens]|nr:Nonribosomal peptide synthetases (NRPS) [Penicillium canescens]